MFYKIVVGNYILAISRTMGTEITEEEYNAIKEKIDNAPVAPQGYGYKLTINLEWELVEIPQELEEEPTAEDYEAALERLGVE